MGKGGFKRDKNKITNLLNLINMKQINLMTTFNPDNLNITQLLGDYKQKYYEMTSVSIDEIKAGTISDVKDENFCPEIVEIIDSIEGTAYNRDARDKVLAKYGWDNDAQNSFFVYHSQQYVHLRDAIIKAVDKAKKLLAAGYEPLTDIETKERKKFYIVGATVNNFLGTEGTKEIEKPQTLIKDAAGQYFFIARSNSRKGQRAFNGMYVRAAQ